MFKKPLKVGGQSQLSGKDKKNLKSSLIKLFDEDSIDHLFNNQQKILSEKISGSKMVVYMDEDSPLFVDPTGKGDFFPSLYSLMLYPNLIPSIEVFEGVEDNIFKGANLMWPGVSDYSGLGDFEKDSVVGIVNAKGSFVGIGALTISKKELNQEAKTGVCLQILTHLNDKLWDHGAKIAPKNVFERRVQKETEKQKVEVKQEEKPLVEEKVPVKKQGKEEKEQNDKKDKKDKKKKKVEESSDGEEKTTTTTSKKPQAENQPKGKPEVKQEVKPEVKAPKEKEPSEPQESDSEQDLTTLIHARRNNIKGVKKIETKKQNVFSDDDEDDKKKKKGGKKPVQQLQKHQPAAKKQESEPQSEEQDFRKGKKKDNKKKKPTDKEKEKEQEDKKKKDKKKKKESSEEEPEEQAVGKIKPELMDEYFKEALLNAIVLGVRDQDLPIDSGQFFTDYMQLGRREGIHLDIKASSYGKMNKFYEVMSKEGIIEFKQAKQKTGAAGATIAKVNRDHEELVDYAPSIKKMGKREAEEQKGEKGQKGEKHDHNLKFQVSKTIQVEEVYRPKVFVQHIFGVKLQFQEKKQKKVQEKKEEKEDKKDPKKETKKGKEDKEEQKKLVINKSDFFTWEECKEKINAYLETLLAEDNKKEKKEEKDKKKDKDKKEKVEKYLSLDYQGNEFLRELLRDQIQEHQENLKRQKEQEEFQKGGEEEQIPQEIEDKKKKKNDRRKYLRIEKEQFQKQIQKYLQAFHRLIDKAHGVLQFKEGKFKGVQVIAEKANNKNVTRVVGIQLIVIPKEKMDQQITNLSNIFKDSFASSVSIHNIPGKAGGKEIMIQGTFLDEIVDMLVDEYGVAKELVVPVNKLDKKKKN